VVEIGAYFPGVRTERVHPFITLAASYSSSIEICQDLTFHNIFYPFSDVKVKNEVKSFGLPYVIKVDDGNE